MNSSIDSRNAHAIGASDDERATGDASVEGGSDNGSETKQVFGDDTDLSKGPVLLYDGECGVCTRSIQWILRHERSQTLRFAALQSQVGKHLIRRANIPENIDSLIWVQQPAGELQARIWSGAVIEALRYVRGPWSTLALMRFIPRPLRDFGYRLFARHRLTFSPKACLLPTPETRARFLDAWSP